MKAIILAGGLGTRLGYLTKDTQKCMISVAGKPILKHIVDNLVLAGITQIIIKLHYKPEQVINYFGNSVLYYYEPVLLTHGQSLVQLSGWFDEDFMVVNGDTLSSDDYKRMIEFHKKGTITVAMEEYRAIGTWIYDKDFTDDTPLIPYRQKGVLWFDCGTEEKLKMAKSYYERYDKN